jgi:enoyl-CoA hydratase/carnithine racemase
MTYERFSLDSSAPSLWRVTFNHPPINLIDSVMIAEPSELFTDVERNNGPAVIIFDSADPDYFLAHYDISKRQPLPDQLDSARAHRLPPLARRSDPAQQTTVGHDLSHPRAARGAGSEFTLATDIRFASRDRAVLGQFEIGIGATPGGGPASHLARWVGRGRAMEILVGGEDFDGDLAERYGYVNRAIPDDEFNDFIDRFARRVAAFLTARRRPRRLAHLVRAYRPNLPERLNKVIGDLCHSFWPIRMPVMLTIARLNDTGQVVSVPI